MDSGAIKETAYRWGADICGVAPAERFAGAPEGFNPKDIYSACKSVLVFAKKIPHACLDAESCVPYTRANDLVTAQVDAAAFSISLELETNGISSVIVPSDDPYEYWDPERTHGRGILSLRHAGHLAGLGYLGKNTLLINDTLGNMIQIGALLLDRELEGDPVIDRSCPDECALCIDGCPVNALDGITVDQYKCRPLSVYKNEKGYVLKKCCACRKICPRSRGRGTT
jgi:epoxyqueuosine reductase QueG